MDDEDRRQTPGRRESDVPAEERVQAILDVGNDIRGLQAAVDGLASVIGSMASKEDVAKAAAEEARKRRWSFAGLAAAILVLVSLVGGNLAVLDEVKDLAVATEASGRLLVECLTPSTPGDEHPCYEREQGRDQAIMAGVSLALLDAATCAVTVAPPDIPRCYAQRIEARTGTSVQITP